VLSEAAPADFRETLLGGTLHLVRRRRRWRQTRRAGGALMLLALFSALVWQNLPNHPAAPTLVAKTIEKSYQLVHTRPFPANAVVTTRLLATEQLIASATTVVVVRTTGGGNSRVINDEELLALLSPRPAVLIRLGPDSERLIFVNSPDGKDFPPN